jgi:hypothetical protein
MSSINVIARDADSALLGLIERCVHVERVASLDELRVLLERPADQRSAGPKTLDLIGHSTSRVRLLRLGEFVIDMEDPVVVRFFQGIARDRLLPRIGITAVRLLGCSTAVELAGQRTMRRLAATLQIPVLGTTKQLMKSHYTTGGFDPAFVHILVDTEHLPAR